MIPMPLKHRSRAEVFFDDWFLRLRGFLPYPWQTALFLAVLAGTPPSLLYIPTGGGKTDLLTAWLLATCFQLSETGSLSIPRRLYSSVDRRIMVDQTEKVALALLGKIQGEAELLGLLSNATASKSTPLVVSVLRGQRVTDQEPLIGDPSRFGIVLCTPDMLLSRLLFAGYGCARGVMSREAGLVGHDAWLVLDEAHLSDAARNVLEFVAQRNRGVKPFWHTCMTATPRTGLTDSANTLRLRTEDLSRMEKTLRAQKEAQLLGVKKIDLAKKIISLVEAQPDWRRLIVYVEQPRIATEICEALAGKYDVRLLTGTMRGLEKDALDLSRFSKDGTEDGPKPVLVCTSAGEVGLDISADFLITEFTNIERLMQRLGRMNRWGKCPKAYGYILKTEEKPRQTRENRQQTSRNAQQVSCDTTEEYLRSLPRKGKWIDVSGATLYKNPPSAHAFSLLPRSLPLDPIVLAELQNTSFPHTIPVDMYIRGVDSNYHVNLVVRREVGLLLDSSSNTLHEYAEKIPVFAGEVFKELADSALLQKLRALNVARVLFVSAQNIPAIIEIAKLPEYALAGLRQGTLYLPHCECVDRHGVFTPGAGLKGDVFAETQMEQKWRRLIVVESEDEGTQAEDLDTQEVYHGESLERILQLFDLGDAVKAKAVFDEPVALDRRLVFINGVPKQKLVEMTLKAHSQKAASIAHAISKELRLPPDIAGALVEASRWHDAGKRHPLWQIAARGPAHGEPLAKTGKPYFHNPRLLGGMRHEFVSALDYLDAAKGNELATWLILSHHGRCRPFFQSRAYDPDRMGESEELNAQVPFIYERLALAHGPWGLAWMEALLRAIDIQSEG